MSNDNKPHLNLNHPLLKKQPGDIPVNGISRKFKMKRVPRPSPYVEKELREQYAQETMAHLNAPEDIQIYILELHYGGDDWDGAGEGVDA